MKFTSNENPERVIQQYTPQHLGEQNIARKRSERANNTHPEVVVNSLMSMYTNSTAYS